MCEWPIPTCTSRKEDTGFFPIQKGCLCSWFIFWKWQLSWVVLALDLNLSCKNIMAGQTLVVQAGDSGSIVPVSTSATSHQGSTCQTDEFWKRCIHTTPAPGRYIRQGYGSRTACPDCGWLVWGSERPQLPWMSSSAQGLSPQPSLLCSHMSAQHSSPLDPFPFSGTSLVAQNKAPPQLSKSSCCTYNSVRMKQASLQQFIFCSAFSSLPSSTAVLLFWVRVSLILCELLAVAGCKAQE